MAFAGGVFDDRRRRDRVLRIAPLFSASVVERRSRGNQKGRAALRAVLPLSTANGTRTRSLRLESANEADDTDLQGLA